MVALKKATFLSFSNFDSSLGIKEVTFQQAKHKKKMRYLTISACILLFALGLLLYFSITILLEFDAFLNTINSGLLVFFFPTCGLCFMYISTLFMFVVDTKKRTSSKNSPNKLQEQDPSMMTVQSFK